MKKFPILIALCGLTFSGCSGGNHESDVSYDDMPYSKDVYDYANGGSYDVAAEEAYFESDAADFTVADFQQESREVSRSVSQSLVPESATRQTGRVITAQASGATETKKIIKTGNMGIRVARIDEARRPIDSLVAICGGYYAEESYNDGYGAELKMTIRVPSGNFDALTAALEAGRGKVLYKNISARDVSEEYLDTEIRLANKRSYLERYRELLKRANTIAEILQVEQYVHRLEVEIESAQGRLRYIDHQTAYSTLELTLSTEQTPVDSDSYFGSRITHALSEGWELVVSFVIGLLFLWPFWLIGGGVLFWFVRRRVKRRKQRGDEKE